jgi:NAD(P)H dehydrogenase (quinone)
MTKVVILGGGPGGYEAALVATQLGAQVTIIERDGIGGSAVLSDVVPSKALVAVAEAAIDTRSASLIGVHTSEVHIELDDVNARLKKWAANQSRHIFDSLIAAGVHIIAGTGELISENKVKAVTKSGEEIIEADVILLATGARPRELSSAIPDGERILNWKQLYDLPSLPEKMIVVGSGVTGAEFAGAFQALGSNVVLISSREQVLPGEDTDAAAVIEQVFSDRGMTVLNRARAKEVRRSLNGVEVELESGEVIDGSHCLMAVGSLPNTENLNLIGIGVATNEAGFIQVDKVSRTNIRGVYAAGDCTGVFMLASVAAMQGRIAMRHALGDAVAPLNLETVSSNVFTDPEIATVGFSQKDAEADPDSVRSVMLPLATNARAKMQGITEGFVKLYCKADSGIIVGGVVVSPKASELIFPIAIAVENRLTADQIAHTFTIYPSLTGSIAEAARRLFQRV